MKNFFSRFVVVCMLMLLCGLVTSVGAQTPSPAYVGVSTDGTPIPDVNKPVPTDASCWLASASNLLGAAGYGTGPDAQMRANNIYNQLTLAWGTSSGGAPDQAISYWLALHGQNPDSPEYMLDNDFTDVTAVYSTIGQSDYDFLRGELERGLYVGVQFANPAHAMTFVGWNHTMTPQYSIWTDSDWLGGNDPYENAFSTSPLQWNLVQMGTTNVYLQQANGYTTFGTGLDKDENMKSHYDVAWYPSPTGPTVREAGTEAPFLDDPTGALGWQPSWQYPGGAMYYPFRIDDEESPFYDKKLSLLVDYYGRDSNYANEDIRLRYLDESGTEVVATPTSVQLSPDNGQVLFTWNLDYQPAWEEILFPNLLDYQFLEGTVASWDIATLDIFNGIIGDANHDGFVDGSDATILANYWQYGVGAINPAATWEMGDFNGDRVVDGSDATLLASHWQEGTPPSSAVPEPSTLLMLCSMLGLWLMVRKGRKND